MENNAVRKIKRPEKISVFSTAILITGITICYILQMSPAPVLVELGEHFGVLENNALMNLAVNIMYPFIIFGCVFGGPLEIKIGTRRMYIVTLLMVAAGSLMNFAASGSYIIFLIARAIFGAGFGFGVPFIGSAIMNWFSPKSREIMNTVNGFFPFIGTLICFSLVSPLSVWSGGSWQFALGVWGILALIALILWVLFVKEENLPIFDDGAVEEAAETHLYAGLLKRKNIKLIIVAFAGDFICYSYIATILPTLLAESGSWSFELAGLAASVAFPGIGLIGCLTGGVINSKSGKRKPQLVCGQVIEFAGIMTAALGANTSVYYVLLGISMYAFGNGLWLPSMYCVPMELEDMTPSRVGGAFSLITAIGFVGGFLSPIVGGLVTDALMPVSGFTDFATSHVFGLRWSLFIFGFAYIMNFICMLNLTETGPGKAAR